MKIDLTLSGVSGPSLTRRDSLKMLTALPLIGTGLPIADAARARTPSQSGTAVAHDGAPIHFEIYGEGPRSLMMNNVGLGNRDGLLSHLTDRYRVIVFDYPGAEPKPYTMTSMAVAADYLRVADAVGAGRFAYYGYSWGAVTGLQLAIRTQRLTALMCGGFPMLGGPYEEMLELTTADVAEAERSGRNFGIWRANLTYYQTLRDFDDRLAQARISCPRLCFIGTEEVIRLPDGRQLTHYGEIVKRHKAELERFDWTVHVLAGKDHGTAQDADIVGPILRPWLDANWNG